MKKLKSTTFLIFALMSLALTGCLAIFPSVSVNDWKFVPQQVSGSQIDLSVFSGSELRFSFTIKNEGEERTLFASTFQIIYKKDETETNAGAIYFDNLQTNVNFQKFESKNIIIHCLSSEPVSNAKSIVIKYDGTIIVEYFVK